MPDRGLVIRFLALSAFIIAVALGLWLLEARPLVVVLGVAAALVIAWAIEWLSWREEWPTMMRSAPPAPVAGGRPEPEDEADQPGLWALPGEQETEVQPPPAALLPPEPIEEEPPAAERVAAKEPAVSETPVTTEEPAAEEPVAEQPAVDEPAVSDEPPTRRPPRLEPVPPPPPPPRVVAPPPPPPPPPRAAEAPVVALRPRSGEPREWNLWELERLARDASREQPERAQEWSYLFVHLRQFATAEGVLPPEFDGLVREAFGRLLERSPAG